ncbi:ferritin-like domain-containing protein [Hymenobacter convexus]|uniref:ferritin-like domain-containing protein n=1 Tax=Hymenobacter sp. CA1UV-4 TaxID=3063782 RepID=UPI0027136F68|nr:ferritin-like domain-containing protein [Hymenobacter sp. CA1UV-4]MDO7850153.1 ferritin-like domain-containing protein [Hymenobacter sp. CA1UV-4]
MNFFQIISEIEKVDPEVYDRLDSRRSIFKHMTGLGQKLSAAAVPLALGSIFNKVYAQTPVGASVNDVLNFALSLEYLESYFYQRSAAGSGASAVTLRGGFSGTNLAAIDLIRTDEANHVTFLRSVLGTAAIADPGAATFDFTGGKGAAGGPFADVLTNPLTYLAVAQSLEDTGVRAYKGGAALLMSNKTVLTAALNIHSVEARHASRLRTMRRAGPMNNAASQGLPVSPYNAAPKSWISGTDNGGAGGSPTGPTAPIYGAGNNTGAPTGVTFDAESNTTQGGAVLTGLPNTTGFPASAFSEAFDEALDVTTVKTIARTFVVNGNNFLA